MARRLLLLLLLALVRPLGADPPAPVSAEAEDLFSRGVDALSQKDPSPAGPIFEDLQRRYPLPAWKARIDFLTAHRLLEKGDDAGAVKAFFALDARSIGLQAYGHYFLATALERLKKRDAAAEWFRTAYAEDDKFVPRIRAALAAARLAGNPAEQTQALEMLESSMATAQGEERRDALAARFELASRLGSAQALERAARDLLKWEPELLESSRLPSALVRQARRLFGDLSETERISVCRRIFDSGDARGALENCGKLSESELSASDRDALNLLRARALSRLGRFPAALSHARKITGATPDGFAARLTEADAALRQALRARSRKRKPAQVRDLAEKVAAELARRFEEPSSQAAPLEIRFEALRSLLFLSAAAGDRAKAVSAAREIVRIDPRASWGFETLWHMTWEKIADKDYAPALAELDELASIYREISSARRLQYWRARCLERLGKPGEATEAGRPLTCADPPDLYAHFASEWKRPCAGTETSEPGERSGEFARVDELLRIRLYDEARDEAAALPESRGKKLRQAAASFALGDFASSSALVKSAFPEIGTAMESSVPEQWRRLYYPIDPEGAVESSAREFGLDRSLWLALVRQESAFNPKARSRAGAVGMTQLMPGTARRLSRKVLRKKFQKAFLYDPAVNVRLGASYLRSLLDEFDNDKLMAVASYNAGPGRIRGFLRDNPDLSADARLEALPFPETRDYVRRVFLYAESYRELYPEERGSAPVATR